MDLKCNDHARTLKTLGCQTLIWDIRIGNITTLMDNIDLNFRRWSAREWIGMRFTTTANISFHVIQRGEHLLHISVVSMTSI